MVAGLVGEETNGTSRTRWRRSIRRRRREESTPGMLAPALPVISNAFSGSKARALSAWFYVGGTVIRAAPHAYDVYAGPRGNLFGGVALDVGVLFGVALLPVLLFLQQRVRLRGAFVCSSSSKRRSGAYRMVSSVPLC